jgi:hypothetical protein
VIFRIFEDKLELAASAVVEAATAIRGTIKERGQARIVATVSGLSGTAAALGTIIVFELAGHLSDARTATGTHLFDPLMVIAGMIPFVGMILVPMLVRNTKVTDQGLVRRI